MRVLTWVAGPAPDQPCFPRQLLGQDVAGAPMRITDDDLRGPGGQCALTGRHSLGGHALAELRVVRVELCGFIPVSYPHDALDIDGDVHLEASSLSARAASPARSDKGAGAGAGAGARAGHPPQVTGQ